MKTVIKWIMEYALTEKSSNLVEGRELDTRVAALRELQRNHDEMSGAKFLETLTTAHFTQYFGDAISRAFYSDYEYKVGSWRNYTFADTAPDFRDVNRFRMTEPGTLHKRREKGEAVATNIADSEIAYGVEEYSRQFDVSWQAIMNDDLGKIRETPQRMAKMASLFEDTFVSALYDNATSQATLVALGALFAGTGRLTTANLAIGLNAMMQRTDVNGNQMNLSKINLVIPPVLAIQAATVLQDLLSFGGPGGNVLGQFVANVYIDPYIAFAAPNVPWYLFADPSEVPTVSVLRLEGFDRPFVYQKASDISMVIGSAPAPFLLGNALTGDIEYTVETIIGGDDDASNVGITDVRGIYYSSGTTP